MYTIVKIGGSGYVFDEEGYYHEYICDSVSDIASLPTGIDMAQSKTKPRPGSTAIVSENSAVYMLSNNRQWKLLIDEEVNN